MTCFPRSCPQGPTFVLCCHLFLDPHCQPDLSLNHFLHAGLQVILYIEEADYNPFLVTSTGAKIVVHAQDEYPFIEDIGTEIETATATSIGMHFVSGRMVQVAPTCAHIGLLT